MSAGERVTKPHQGGGDYDVIIVGGGPAGLSAALVLGRARRSVIVIDHGKPRNIWSRRLHGYLTRDGIDPLQLLRLGRDELARYGVHWHGDEVVSGQCLDPEFEVLTADGQNFHSRKLVLATGVRDVLPDIENIEPFYGKSVHHCPYCDGWEWRDQPLAAYGRGRKGLGLALSLLTWSSDVVIVSDGDANFDDREHHKLRQMNLRLRTESIARLEGHDGQLERIVFHQGEPLARRALFFNTDQRLSSPLAEHLGCRTDATGGIVVDARERTGVPGLFVVGDASHDVQFAIVAAAEGAKAATAINAEMQAEEGRVLDPPKD